jgi:hypothetical protein
LYCLARAAICCPLLVLVRHVLDDALLQPTLATVRCWIVAYLSLLRLPVGTHLHLIRLGVLNLAFDADGLQFLPPLLPKRLLVGSEGLFEGSHPLFDLRVLGAARGTAVTITNAPIAAIAASADKRAKKSVSWLLLWFVLPVSLALWPLLEHLLHGFLDQLLVLIAIVAERILSNPSPY